MRNDLHLLTVERCWERLQQIDEALSRSGRVGGLFENRRFYEEQLPLAQAHEWRKRAYEYSKRRINPRGSSDSRSFG